ncbi:MAG TPA: hypothetical protein P5337_08340 [Aestuariivirga sp.]|nr:hypothetical protein [Aestuariivirga sp.]
MKLVEVVFLVGTQCISPVQTVPHVTVAGKVQCAVVIHQDTEQNKFYVTPGSKANHPSVRLALRRAMQATGTPAGTTRVVVDATPVTSTKLTPRQQVAVAAIPSGGVIPANGKQGIFTSLLREKAAARSAAEQPAAQPQLDIRPTSAGPDVNGPADELAANSSTAGSLSPGDRQPAPKAVDDMADQPEASPSKPEKARSARRSTSADPKIAKLTRNMKTVCRYPRTAKWYKNKSGHLKYRCVKSSKQAVY